MFLVSLCECSVFWNTLAGVIVMLMTIKLLQWLFTDTSVPIPDVSKRHNWRNINTLGKACYCSICESLMLNNIGVYCDCCGVCADPPCVKKADRKLPCKIVNSEMEGMPHHWVQGNLPPGACCVICDDDCCINPGLCDFQCCWCQRTVHTDCKLNMDIDCDLGPWRRLIIPPWTIRVAGRRSSVRRHQHVQSVTHPGWTDWMPLIIIGNRKSGNGDCDTILSHFRRFLNPLQVIDLEDKPPIIALQWASLLEKALRQGDVTTNASKKSVERVVVDDVYPDKSTQLLGDQREDDLACRFLVAGGDGTISWILNVIHNMRLKPAPSVAILPLGTGNDLSRVLGWGKASARDLDPCVVLQQIIHANPIKLDRWHVDIKPIRHLGLRLPSKSVFMYNYLSIGVDAQVTLDFHRTRESRFYIFSSRIFNKLLYLIFGTHQALATNCQNMQDRLELYMDGLRVELPPIESIVVLNIPSWGAGVPLWSMGGCEGIPAQSMSDGKLEVLAIFSSFHIAQLQVGLSQPHRLGQAKTVEIKVIGSSPIQVDGEPWEQHPAYITISYTDQANLLRKD